MRAREAERERAEALAELDRAKTDFFSNVSHEFRTPLSLILGPAEDALAEAEDDEQGERLNVVFRNALRLQKLVNNLLEFSRIEAGRAEPLREPTDVAAFTADLASMFRAATDRAGIALVVERPDGPVIARVDREMWERIVLNLVSNAFKFTFEGEIRVTLRRDGADAVLSSPTRAPASPPTSSRACSSASTRRGARSRTHEGSGIGLALVRSWPACTAAPCRPRASSGRARRSRSACRSRSAAPAGAATDERRRRLPRGGAALAARRGCLGRRAGGGRRGPAGGDGACAGRRVLVADDNADMRDYLAGCSRATGVERGRRPRRPGGRARARPDLVLSDAMMPELDGFGLLAELRADPGTSQLPVILLSARAGEEARSGPRRRAPTTTWSSRSPRGS